MSKPIYRWSLTVGAEVREIRPRYDASLTVLIEEQPGEVFFRRKLSGALEIQRTDFDWLLGIAGLEDRIEISLEDFTGTWNGFFLGFFYLTDCKVDMDNKTLTVTPTPDDLYEDILTSLDKEFDLVQLAVPATPVNLRKQPVFQLYCRGASRITNIVGSVFWDQEVTPENDVFKLENDYKFGAPGFVLYIPGDATVLDPDVSGNYIYNGSGNNYLREDGAYEIRLNPALSLPSYQWEIVEKPSDTAVYRKPVSNVLVHPDPFTPAPTPFTSLSSSSTCHVFSIGIYLRILTNNEVYGGADNHPYPDPDLLEQNPNYTRVVSVDLNSDVVFGASDHSPTTPSIYGKFADTAENFAGEWFQKPSPTPPVGTLFPVLQYLWQELSVWFYYDASLLAALEASGEDVTIRDCYALPDVLSSLLGQITGLVGHENTPSHSDFFYGASNPIRGGVKYPFFTPKTNITVGNYDKPAWKAPLKLGDLLQFLKQAFGVFWYIDSSGRFVLEHVKYFWNGKSYGTAGVGVDVTALLDPRTGKPWGYRQNVFTFEKEVLPEQVRWKWMDGGSRGFEGYPLEIISGFVQKGNIEDRTMTVFSADIDFAIAQTSAISPEGFFFLEALFSGGEYSVPFVEVVVSPEEVYTLQNGYAALTYMVPQYHKEDLPALNIRINKAAVLADSVKRAKLQEIEYPSGVEPDPMLLVTTGLGTGRIREMAINVSSRGNKMTIRHDTTI